VHAPKRLRHGARKTSVSLGFATVSRCSETAPLEAGEVAQGQGANAQLGPERPT
jgi:hypothetical protein